MIGVRFTRGHGNYNRGEVACFPEEVARRLIEGGAALPVDGAAQIADAPPEVVADPVAPARAAKDDKKAAAAAALPGQGAGSDTPPAKG